MNYLTEEINQIKNKLDIEVQRNMHSQRNEVTLDDTITKLKLLETKSLKYDEVFDKLLESMSTRDKRTKELEYKFSLFDKILNSYNEKFKIIETQITEIKDNLKTYEPRLSKLNDNVSDNSNDIIKISFLQERIDQMSGLFRGSEFRLSSLEHDFAKISTDLKQLVITIQDDVNEKMSTNINESNQFNNNYNKIKSDQRDKHNEFKDARFKEDNEEENDEYIEEGHEISHNNQSQGEFKNNNIEIDQNNRNHFNQNKKINNSNHTKNNGNN